MNKVVKIGMLVAMAALFSYCKKPTEFKEIEINNQFLLEVPVYLHSTTDLMPDNVPHIHQYDDSVENVCLLIFDTARAGFEISNLKTFFDSMVAHPVMDSAVILAPELVKIDNDSAYQSEITGRHNNTRLFGEMVAIGSKDRFYFMLTWSSLDRRKELKYDMNKMLHSFREEYPKK